ncbi:M23 family metallopeptidase [Sungkyunkwania multivorans]|uniref:M23 family metallopeptidase n=1 Tax=Sungkyunkwania multivorans TaxID=1173618 RepID=A0ABW3D2E5_9FLAO
MVKEETKRKKLRRKLLHKYRLVILNEDTFEERVSFKLTRLNVFVFGSLFALFLIAGTTVLIAFTPLREYIPGYSSTALKRKAAELKYKTDSLEVQIAQNTIRYDGLVKVLMGDVSSADIAEDSIQQGITIDPSSYDFTPNRQDSLLREAVAQEDKYNLFESAISKANFVLFPPVTGTITQGYNPNEKHYAVDVATAANAPVKAVADGTVIFSEWTTETGYVIIIEHSYRMISVYKHNSSLIKQQGELVKSGEVIAVVGNTGEFSTGPHLHFELWSDGYHVDPTNFIDFE